MMVRLPNLFTIPSNIIVGYITFLESPSIGFSISLPLVVISSCLIYTAGIIFNDYYDIETDRREGRLRPLVSGLVSKKAAIVLALACLSSALIISAFVGFLSFLVSFVIIVIALLYDYKLKRTKIASIAMASTRAFNVIYGASPILLIGLLEIGNLQRLIIESACVFLYVVAIMMVSAKEAGAMQTNRKWLLRPILLIFAVAITMCISVILGKFRIDLLVNLVFLIAIISYVIYKLINRFDSEIRSGQIQNLVKILVLCMVILDSAFASGISGLFFGITVASFIIPGLILSRLLYVT